jgi:endogenous inhibitor of DNA gyrase (YacG/DUF329 family)
LVGISQKEICKHFNVSISTIKRLFIKHNIKSNFNKIKNIEITCLECNINFQSKISENRKFCSQSCSASFNNKKRIKDEYNLNTKKRIRISKLCKQIGICICCDKEIHKNNGNDVRKYCNSKCQPSYQREIKVNNNTASSRTLKLYLIEKYGNCCMECGWNKKNPITGNVPIELELIDGNSENNKLDNLKLLCPNCHSLTPTYKALNLGSGRFNRRKRYNEGKSG